jgi:hypothetical protein
MAFARGSGGSLTAQPDEIWMNTAFTVVGAVSLVNLQLFTLPDGEQALDAADRLIGILLADSPEEEKERWSEEAFAAILDEDQRAIPGTADLVGYVRTEVAR